MSPASRPRAPLPAWPLRSLALAALLLPAAPPAQANPWSLHATGTVAGAWSDNPANAPEVAREGENLPEPSFYTQIRPSLLFAIETARSVHEAVYVLDLSLYQAQDLPNTTNHSLAYRGRFATSSRTELGVGASLDFGNISSLLTAAAPGAEGQTTTGDANLSGGSRYLSYGVEQSLRWQTTPNWIINQGLGISRVDTDVYQVQNSQPQRSADNHSNRAGLTLGGDRSWARTALGLSGGVTYLSVEQIPRGEDGMDLPAGAGVVRTKQLTGNAGVSVRRDLDPRWTASASAGIAAIVVLQQEPPRDGGDGVLAPIGEGTIRPTPTFGLSVDYLRPVGPVIARLGLSAGKTIESNLFLGISTDTTSGTLRGSIPLPWLRRGAEPTVQASGSLGMSYAAPFFEAGAGAPDAPSWLVYSADMGLQWNAREDLAVSLRYQYFDTDVLGYDPANQALLGSFQPPVDFFRNTILVQVSGRYPARQAAAVPGRASRRVDAGN